MTIQNRWAALAYQALLALLSGLGVCLSLGLPHYLSLNELKFFTLQSNLLGCVYFSAATIHTALTVARGGPRGGLNFAPWARGPVVAALAATLLVYQLMLAKAPFSLGPENGTLGNRLVHLVVPALALLHSLLFCPRGAVRAKHPLLWCTLPLGYFMFVLIAAGCGTVFYGNRHFPYPFMDFERLGTTALANVALIAAAFLTMGYLALGLDKLLARLSAPCPA